MKKLFIVGAIMFAIAMICGCDFHFPTQAEREAKNPQNYHHVIPITTEMSVVEREIVEELNRNRQRDHIGQKGRREELIDKLVLLQSGRNARPIVIEGSER